MTVAEVNAVAQAFHDGVANQDAAALASLYAEDGRFLPPDMEPSEGPSSIQAAMQMLSTWARARSTSNPSMSAKRGSSRSSTAATGWGSSPRARPQ